VKDTRNGVKSWQKNEKIVAKKSLQAFHPTTQMMPEKGRSVNSKSMLPITEDYKMQQI
jgi:hypothetical protein